MIVLAVLVYLAVGASSVALIAKVGASGRSRTGGVLHDVYEAAFLGGGPARVVDAALAGLHADGRLVIGGPGIVSVRQAAARDLVERAVFDQLAAAPTGALHTLRLAVMRSHAVQEIGDGLAARGLMVLPGSNRSLTGWGLTQGVLCLIGFPVSFVLTIIAGKPLFLALVMPVLIGGLVIGFVTAARARRRITSAGRDALRSYTAQYATAYSAANVVALYGLRAVPDPALQAQLMAAARIPAARTHSTHSAYSSSDPYTAAVVWCAGSSPGSGSGCGGSSGSSCGGSSGSSCSGSSGGSSCSSSSGGSSCSSSSGSSCSSSSSS
ncbi:TIGR04222 domain-containing membrane protein [Streptomyces sp. NPDC020681]|uniref:TIGR04222 domain-containing membrane protein n=1 Tax=Streptomyces sp. NPDC020681 TaxID=3365083 RepID=UPI0037A0ABBC